MTLYAIAQPVVDRPHGQVKLVEAECPFDVPQVAVAGNYFFWCKVGVGDVSLDSVPCRIGFKAVYVYAHLHVALQAEVFVVPAIVYVLPGQLSRPHLLLQPRQPFLTVAGILSGSLLCAGEYEPPSRGTLRFRDVAVSKPHAEDAAFHSSTL